MKERAGAPFAMAKILVVDDSSFQRRMLSGLLRRMGHEVCEADCGATGITALEAEEPDVLLLDLLMPEVTGYELLQRLQQSDATVPRIVLTADVQQSARQRCLELGALRVLHKPPKEDELRQTIDEALAAPGTGR